MKRLILASASAGRKQVMDTLGISYEIEGSDYQEDMSLPLKPRELAIHLSLGKARTVAIKHSNAVVIGADSFVVYKGKILGKPSTRKRAVEMLKLINGKAHSFITGFSLIDCASGKTASDSAETKVYLKRLSPAEIKSYINKEKPLDKAGAYVLQGLGGSIVERIEGEYSNIIGLPLAAVTSRLKQFGIKVL